MNVSEIKKGFHELPLDDRLQLLQELWEELADDPTALDLTPTEQAELESRFERHRANPAAARTWEQFKIELPGRH